MSSIRQHEILNKYIHELDKHMEDLKSGRAENTYEIRDFAEILHVHPTHLSNTIHEVLGKSPCSLYEERLMHVARNLILETNLSISAIARQLSYDPSNFVKFFKHFEGTTPKKFREQHFQKN
ncbi:MAG: helix-turn-helix transcriptional regulator [Bacteroidetes bacterium]|nr:helix-turn-helix transcriptional regulator [Bacteroidota bacterium]